MKPSRPPQAAILFHAVPWITAAILLMASPHVSHAFRINLPKSASKAASPANSAMYINMCNSAKRSIMMPGSGIKIPKIVKPSNGSFTKVSDNEIFDPQTPCRWAYTTVVVCTDPAKGQLFLDVQGTTEDGRPVSHPTLYHLHRQQVLVDQEFGVCVNAPYRMRASYDKRHWGPWVNFKVNAPPKAHPFPSSH